MSKTLTIAELETKTLKDLYALARDFGVSYYAKLNKKELIFAILKAQAEKDGKLFVDGILEIIPTEGFGFLRPINYAPSPEDIYISASQIRRFDLRNGDFWFPEKHVHQKKMSVISAYYTSTPSMVTTRKARKNESTFQA